MVDKNAEEVAVKRDPIKIYEERVQRLENTLKQKHLEIASLVTTLDEQNKKFINTINNINSTLGLVTPDVNALSNRIKSYKEQIQNAAKKSEAKKVAVEPTQKQA